MIKREHPIISLFRQRAELMDAVQGSRDPDDAIVKLAIWMSINIKRLDMIDIDMLSQVGGLMYSEKLRRQLVTLEA